MMPRVPDGAPRFVEESHGQGAGWLGPLYEPMRIDAALVDYVAQQPGELLTDNSGLAVAAGKPIEFEFQIFQLLRGDDHWSEQPVLEAIAEHRFALVALMHPLDGPIDNTTFLAGYGGVQALPGPVFTFSAYLGALIKPGPQGLAGATLALVAIFIPGLLLSLAAFAQPAPTPLARLESNIRRVTNSVNATWGIYIKCLETGEEIAIDADRQMDTMSVIKIPLMAEAFHQI